MNFEKVTINIPCPECEFQNETTLGAAANGDSIICIGCLKTIQFIDDVGSSKRALEEVNRSFDDLRRTLNGN